MTIYNNLRVPINQFTINNGCRLKIVANGFQTPPIIAVYETAVTGLDPDFKSYSGQLTIDFIKNGTYFVAVLPSTYILPLSDQIPVDTPITTPDTFSLSLYTYCNKFCTSTAFPTAPISCTACGNGILE